MAETKRILIDRPEPGDLSQYNFNSNETNFDYENSTSLPLPNDKFQGKDLFTKVVGHPVNEGIIERNLKFAGDPSIKIDNLYIGNTGVGGTVKNVRVAVFMFSEKAYGADPTGDGYTTLKNNLWDNDDDWLIYDKSFGNQSEGSDIGNLEGLEGVEIVSNFGKDSTEISVGDIPGRKLSIDEDLDDDIYIPSGIKAFELSDILDVGTNNDELLTSLFNQQQNNPIYIVVYMKGDKKVAWPIKTDSRKRKYSIFKISNEDLFQKTGDSFSGTNYTVNFNSSTRTRTGEGGGGATQAAWKVSSLTVSFNTSPGIGNNFSDVSSYSQFIPEVLPPVSVNENIFNSFDWLGLLNPKSQLDNDQPAGGGSNAEIPIGRQTNDRHPDYFPFTTFGYKSLNQNILDINSSDLQTYHQDFNSIMKSSAPLNVTFNLDIKDINNNPFIPYDFGGEREYYYFVIDWDDTENKFKTIDDFLISKPENEFDYLELQNQNLYKVKKVGGMNFNTDPNYLATLPFPQYREEFNISATQDGYDLNFGFFRTEYGQLHFNDISVWAQAGRPDISQYLVDLNIQDVMYDNDFGFPFFRDYEPDTELQIPSAQDAGVTPQSPTDFLNPSSVYTPSSITETLNNVYTTPGIKNLKVIMFSIFNGVGNDDSPDFEVGRWKLITSRFYLDISPNQYPDFGDVGGSDFATIPWPHTTVVIGGVDENSKYKTSIEKALSGGKIGDLDLIDERFLVFDSENDEIGKSIKQMDLEQVRYFNQSYNMNTLLNLNPFQNETFTPFNYRSPKILSNNQELIWPGPDLDLYDENGETNIPLEITSIIGVGLVAEYVPEYGGLIGNLTKLVEGERYTFILSTDSISWNLLGTDVYWDGIVNNFSEESSVGQIFINDNQDTDLKRSCQIELNTGNLTDKAIIDTSGNSNKGLLIGDYKVKKVRKGEPLRRDSFIKIPKKTGNSKGAL